jgi:hypothetical protein
MMTKRFGAMTGKELDELYSKHLIGYRSSNEDPQISINRSTLVSIIREMKDAANSKFFFELGRSLSLEESIERTKQHVPPQYLADFEDGVDAGKCKRHSFKTINVIRGRITICSEAQHNKKN